MAAPTAAVYWACFQLIRFLITATFKLTALVVNTNSPDLESLLVETKGGVKVQEQNPRSSEPLRNLAGELRTSMTSENL